jgi:putative transposase
MSNKPKSQRPARDRAVDALTATLAKRGELHPQDYAEQSKICGYSPRHLQRCVKSSLASQSTQMSGPKAFSVDENVVVAVFRHCGRLAATRRWLIQAGQPVPSVSTFRRHVIAAMGTDKLAYAREGSAKFRDAQIFLHRDVPHRMHSIELDHTELPIYVVPRGHKHAIKPWMTLAMDAATRYPLGWVITFGRPTADEVRATLVQAMNMRYAPDGVTPVGGRPLRAVWDRGLEFLSNLITESCLRLDVIPVALPAYSPNMKGRLERFWGFLKTDALSHLPGYTDGPYDLRGNTSLANAGLGEDEFLTRVADWMDWYVTEYVHSATKMTPLQMWKADGTPLDPIDPERLWLDFLVAKEKCKVSKNGIRWNRIDWIAPELQGKVGRHVEVRYLPHEDSFIEVFIDDDHLCTATPNIGLDDETSHQILERRVQAKQDAQKRQTAANRQRKQTSGDVHRLVKDKDGRRSVVDQAEDDLLVGGEHVLKEILGPDLDQNRLF